MNTEEQVQPDEKLAYLKTPDYDPVAPRVLVKEPLSHGLPVPQRTKSMKGQAYILTERGGEVLSTPFEGAWVPPLLFRVASFPVVFKEDLQFSPGLELVARDESIKAIHRQIDGRLFVLLAEASEDRRLVVDEINASVLEEMAEKLTYEVKLNEKQVNALPNGTKVEPANVIVNEEHREVVEQWVKDSEREIKVLVSEMVPVPTVFMTADRTLVGSMPVWSDIEIQDWKDPVQFKIGWVLDTLLGLLLLQPEAVGMITVKKDE
jgi:hypothetical protein